MDDNTKTIDKDQQALLAFVDDLLSQRQDLNIPEERRQDVRIAMLGEVNEHINQHLVRLLSSEGKKEMFPLIVLVDGKTKIVGLKYDQEAIVKGDRKVFAIACASIIAKVYRDKIMVRYAKKYPGYGFEKHKGYGTKYHQAQLAVLGPSLIHRRSFKLTF